MKVCVLALIGREPQQLHQTVDASLPLLLLPPPPPLLLLPPVLLQCCSCAV
jgi:hypothetical protein